jgi:hypothetical protein
MFCHSLQKFSLMKEKFVSHHFEKLNFHDENKPTGYMIFHLFRTDPTCFGLNDHHPGIKIKLLEAFKTIQC